MSQLNSKIGPKIKAFRRQLGLQANKLAEELNISPSYLNLIESGKRKIDGDLLLKVCEKLNIELSHLTLKTDINLENTISEILDDKLFEDLDILGPEVKDLVSTNQKIGKAIVRLGDILKKKDHELINKIEKISGKIVDNRKNSFPGEVISDFLQENKNYFPKLEDFANKVFDKIQKNNRTRYIALCDYLMSEYSIKVIDAIPEENKPFSKKYNKNKKELLLSDYSSLETKKLHAAAQIAQEGANKEIDSYLLKFSFPSDESKKLTKVALLNYCGACLQDPKLPGIPFHFLRVDMAGNISKRFSLSGIDIPRYGGACPRWNVYSAFTRPGVIQAAVSKMTNGEKYVCIARTVEKGIGRFGQAKSVLSIGLGCDAKYAKDFVYTESVNINDKSTEIPIGVSCRTCDRLDCSQRAFPPLHKKFNIDINSRGVSIYVNDKN